MNTKQVQLIQKTHRRGSAFHRPQCSQFCLNAETIVKSTTFTSNVYEELLKRNMNEPSRHAVHYTHTNLIVIHVYIVLRFLSTVHHNIHNQSDEIHIQCHVSYVATIKASSHSVSDLRI